MSTVENITGVLKTVWGGDSLRQQMNRLRIRRPEVNSKAWNQRRKALKRAYALSGGRSKPSYRQRQAAGRAARARALSSSS